jgi:hypothetical protein
MFTPGLKSAVFTRLTLDSNDSFTLRGYLAAGGERETAYIGNATVYVYDADNGTLYAQTATTNSVDSQRLLDIGGFSVKLPQSDHSYHIYIEFKGNSQYAPCISQTLTVNSVSDITLQYFQ